MDKELNLEQVKQMGEELTPPIEMAHLLEVPEEELQDELENTCSPVRHAYMLGVATTANELRKQNIRSAMAGSPASIMATLEQLKQCKL